MLIWILAAQTQVIDLPSAAVNEYCLTFSVPSNLPVGEWRVHVHNGFGGPSQWAAVPETLTCGTAEADWKTTIFNVASLGLASALKKVRAPTAHFLAKSSHCGAILMARAHFTFLSLCSICLAVNRRPTIVAAWCSFRLDGIRSTILSPSRLLPYCAVKVRPFIFYVQLLSLLQCYYLAAVALLSFISCFH